MCSIRRFDSQGFLAIRRPSLACFLDFLVFFMQGFPCCFERFSLRFQGFGGSSRDKKSLFLGVFLTFLKAFSKKNTREKEGQGSTAHECLFRIVRNEFATTVLSSQGFRTLCYISRVFNLQSISLRIRITATKRFP